MIELWALALHASKPVVQPVESWLDAAELERANGYATPGLRQEFVATRGVLRLLLAARSRRRPADLALHTGPRGKPALAGSPLIHFNVSHSGGLALYALSARVEVGIDVEALRPLPDVEQLVARVMSPAQAARWRALPVGDRVPAFYRDWTRKEACVKASGDGLWAELNEIGFSDAVPQPGTGRLCANDASGKAWSLCDLDVGAGHMAALAWCGEVLPVGPLRWLDEATLHGLASQVRALRSD